jgi:hypothetical protein
MDTELEEQKKKVEHLRLKIQPEMKRATKNMKSRCWIGFHC